MGGAEDRDGGDYTIRVFEKGHCLSVSALMLCLGCEDLSKEVFYRIDEWCNWEVCV